MIIFKLIRCSFLLVLFSLQFSFSLYADDSGSPFYYLTNTKNKDNFYTTNKIEYYGAIKTFGYEPKGILGYIYLTKQENTVALERYYSPIVQDHFYILATNSKPHLLNILGYSFEGIVGYVYQSQVSNSAPIFRLWDQVNSKHFYTTDAIEKELLIKIFGYINEGIEGYLAKKISVSYVDFSSVQGEITHVASGFLHNPKNLTWPPQDLLKQVKPKQTREPKEIYLDNGMYKYITQDLKINSKTLVLNARAMKNGYWPGDNGNWAIYEDYIANVVNTNKAKGYIFEYEIWNEPNGAKHFWGRSDKQFFETWKHAVKVIRRLNPEALIIGPSTSNFEGSCDFDGNGNGKRETYIEEFLGFAKANDVVPDILNWHELNLPPDRNPVGGAANIKAHVAQARKLIADLQLPIKKIYINEYSSDFYPPNMLYLNEKYNGAFAIDYFSALEEAKVDVALRACWNERDFLNWEFGNACFDRMDNLMTPDGKPRSNYYTYKAYAEMEGSIVKFELAEGISGIATINKEEKSAKILIGTKSPVKAIPLNLKNLPLNFGKYVHVIIEKIPYSGNREASPAIILEKDYSNKNGILSLQINNTHEGDILVININ